MWLILYKIFAVLNISYVLTQLHHISQEQPVLILGFLDWLDTSGLEPVTVCYVNCSDYNLLVTRCANDSANLMWSKKQLLPIFISQM